MMLRNTHKIPDWVFLGFLGMAVLCPRWLKKIEAGADFQSIAPLSASEIRDQTSLRGGPISSPFQIDNQIPGPPV